MSNLKTGIRTGASPTKGSNKPLGFFMGIVDKIKNLSQRQKMFSAIAIGGIILVVVLVNVFIHANSYVALYNNPISLQDATAISLKLNEMRVSHEIAEGGQMILVQPAQKSKLQMQLAFYGLPHPPVARPDSSKEQGFAPKTTQEITDMQRQRLEGDLILAIREIDGIANVNVKISLSDKNRLFDEGPAKASVMLKLQPGVNLSSDKVAAISHFVAYSVPDLEEENVKIIDTNGRFYKHSTAKSEVGQLSPADQERLIAYKNKFESGKIDKIRGVLDPVLGSDKYTVTVDAEIDFGQTDTTTVTHGGPANVTGSTTIVETTEEETFTNAPKTSGTEQISLNKFSSNKGDTNYNKKRSTKQQKIDTRTERKINTSPVVERLTASVAVDGLKKDQVANIKGLVEGAIGFNEARGDAVKVISMPFSSDVMQKMKEELMSGPAVIPTKSSAKSPISQWFLAIALIPVILLVGIAAYLFMKEREMGLQKVSSDSQTATSLDTGYKSQFNNTTALKLELLAKEKPTKVAELLKSTWLADKER